ncbi:MAG: biotin/lipoyl-binding protein [Patescibacteria group bacterium]|jgi:multidrug efflux pump subunit AcrA (membrane-fusion protein)
MLKKIITGIKQHKITVIILLLTLVAAGYYVYGSYTPTASSVSYETTTVKKGAIKSVVSGSGQVGDANQVNLMPEVSGEITEINVQVGNEVVTGDVIAEIDDADLESQITQAQLALKTAKLNLAKMQEVPDASTLTKANNEIITAENNLEKLKLTQEHDMAAAKEEKKTAKNNLASLDETAENYDQQKATYTNQYNAAVRKIEDYALSQPMAITEAEAGIEEKEQALTELKAGASSTELAIQQLEVQDKQSKLADLISQREDYIIKAPTAGMVALINYTVGETINGGSANVTSDTALAVIISKTKNATIAINEVDVPKISVGQKVDLTFDALPDLAITGTVTAVDLIGTVEQNVVYNNATINFDTQDDRIMNGMTVTANIIIQNKMDILILPTTAIKTKNQASYVQLPDASQVTISIGISDDDNTEITSGLKEGDIVVLKTKTSTTNTNSNTTSIIPMGGGPRD